ncbi:formylglycine-generating enzyme family protein [Planctomycetota bacterium]
MDTKRPKQGTVVIISSFLLLLIAALYTPDKSTGKITGNRMEVKSSSVSSILNQIIGEPNETTEEPNEVIAEPEEPEGPVAESEPLEDSIWYAGTWDSTLYYNTRFPRTVAIRMKLLDKETHEPIRGAGVSIKGEYEHTWTGPGAQSQIDLSIFRDLKTLPPQRRKFGLDAISDSNGFVVFSLNWHKEYSWQDKTEDKESHIEAGGVIIHPDGIECAAISRIGHPDYKDVEIPVDFKRKSVKPVALDLGQKFPDFKNKRSRRIEFFEKIQAEDDNIAYGDVMKSGDPGNKTKCGPYLVYDLGEVLLERTAPRPKVRRPGGTSAKETRVIPKPRPTQTTKPPEKTVKVKDQTRRDIRVKTPQPKEPPKTVEPKDRIVRESKPDQKSIEQPGPVAQTAGAGGGMTVASRIDSKGKIVNFGDGVTMRLLLIPKGEFLMGSPADEMGRDPDEGPARKVRFDKPFYMGVYEVTQEQYEKIMGTNPSKRKDPKFPVHMVSWNEAREFCRRLSSLAGEQFRLPTEAEWEYACRAGTTTAFYWGNSFDDQYAWSLNNSKGTLHEVGTRLPNAWGLFDMSGNLWEWCEDPYIDHIPGPDELIDLKDASDRADRTLRGGSWNVNPLFSRSANRSRNTPNIRMDYNGFRVVMDVK